MTQPPRVIQSWIEQIKENSHKLNKWEESFIESIDEQWFRKQWISDRQEEILERIYAEKT